MDKNYILYEKVVEPIQVSLPTKPINKLPNRYSYEKLNDGKELKANVKQQFKYEVNEFNSSYLVSEDGGKIKLSEEDTKFLKEKGVKTSYKIFN